ncbi:MAG: tRNA/rRNA cytosine-C5-methylase [Actinobacteria bacterium]|nr:tRNA/rRNA cytosine-C5-methylase [Actinomycetota bacterium]
MVSACKLARNLNSKSLRDKSARQIAWELLYEIDNSELYSNLVVPRTLSSSSLEARDRALVTNLVYGTLRMRGFLDGAIRKYLDRELTSVDLRVLTVLRMGAYQLLILKTPVHAAVNEIVDLAKVVCGKSAASYVNAVMRRLSENLDVSPASMSEEYSHPEWVINAFKDSLKDEALVKRQLEANNEIALPTLVCWPDRSTHEELLAAGASMIPGTLNAFSFKGNPGDIPAIRERRAGVQDLGSQIVAETFVATKSENHSRRWLDLCAGPGGKAAYMESLLPEDELVVNEPTQVRANLLAQVVKRSKVESFDGRQIPVQLGLFDRILVDAPCTGLGALRRRPEVRWRRKPSDLRALVELQQELLESAATRVNVGGIIGYATCSPHIAETKMQVNDFLKRHPNFNRLKIGPRGDNDGDLQLWTFRDGTDCMYLSLLERQS